MAILPTVDERATRPPPPAVPSPGVAPLPTPNPTVGALPGGTQIDTQATNMGLPAGGVQVFPVRDAPPTPPSPASNFGSLPQAGPGLPAGGVMDLGGAGQQPIIGSGLGGPNTDPMQGAPGTVANAPPTTPTQASNFGSLPQAGTQDFGPGNNIIGQQINPGTFNPEQDTQNTRGMVNDLLQSTTNSPSRLDLAQQAFKTLDENTNDQRQRGIQQTGQAAARLGRLGSGMVTTDLGNLEDRLQQNRDQALRGLSVETAGQQLQDQFGRLGAAQGVYGQQFGADQGTAGTRAGERGELRGERGYQYGLDQGALDRRIQQAQLGQQFANDEQQRNMAYNSQLGGYGYAAQSPVYQQLANQYGNNAAASGQSAGELLNAVGQYQRPQQQPYVPQFRPPQGGLE